MTEKVKQKDVLRQWLTILTIIFGLIWLGFIIVFPDTIGNNIIYGILVLAPIILSSSWILWGRDMRGFSITLSVIQVLITLFMALFLVVKLIVPAGSVI